MILKVKKCHTRTLKTMYFILPVRIILPFKDQRLADLVRRQLSDLAKKINSDLRPVFTSRKIADEIKVTEPKPPLINEQCVVYEYKCDLCDADYVGYTCRHLFQRINYLNERKHSVIGKHLRDVHNLRNKDLRDQFTILKKCRRKLDCLIYEMRFIKNKQKQKNQHLTLNLTPLKQILYLTVQAHHAWNFILFYFLLSITCTETFTRTFH